MNNLIQTSIPQKPDLKKLVFEFDSVLDSNNIFENDIYDNDMYGINFDSSYSNIIYHNNIYDNTKIKVFDGTAYEELTDCEHKYRVIFSSDDYDYVQDEVLIDLLDIEDYI